jgi:hypothetical protein
VNDVIYKEKVKRKGKMPELLMSALCYWNINLCQSFINSWSTDHRWSAKNNSSAPPSSNVTECMWGDIIFYLRTNEDVICMEKSLHYFHFKSHRCYLNFTLIAFKIIKMFLLIFGWPTKGFRGSKWSVVQRNLRTLGLCYMDSAFILWYLTYIENYKCLEPGYLINNATALFESCACYHLPP